MYSENIEAEKTTENEKAADESEKPVENGDNHAVRTLNLTSACRPVDVTVTSRNHVLQESCEEEEEELANDTESDDEDYGTRHRDVTSFAIMMS